MPGMKTSMLLSCRWRRSARKPDVKHNEDDWRQEITFWKNAGVTPATAHTTYISKHHRRVDGRSAAERLASLTRYRAAVADLL